MLSLERPVFPASAAVFALLLGACASTRTAPESVAEPVADATGETSTSEPEQPPDVMSALMAGEFAWQDGRGASAAKHFMRAAELSDDPKIAEHATRVALASKEWDLARTAVARWRALDPDAAGIVQAQAALALGAGDAEQAQAMLEKLIATGEDGRKLAGQALLASPDKQAAAAALGGIAGTPELEGGVDTLLLMGQIAQQVGDDAVARRYADRAVEGYPDSYKAWYWRAHLRAKGDDQAGAKSDFEHAIKVAPDNRDVRLGYAALLDSMGDPAAAARSLVDAKAEDDLVAARAAYAVRADDRKLMREAYAAIAKLPEPHPPARLELLGQMAELVGDKAAALDWYGKVPSGDRYLSSQLRIAVVLDETGKSDEAQAHLRKLRTDGIDDDDKLTESYLLEAELYTRHDRREDALDAYNRGLKILPDERRLLYARALLNEGMDHIAEAERDLRRIVELDPDDPDALNALGYTLADRTQRFDEAFELIEKALKLKPDEPAIIDSMGWVEFRRGNHDEALKHLERAFKLQPDAEIAAHLGEVMWVTGDRSGARRIWSEGRKHEADNKTLLETIGRHER